MVDLNSHILENCDLGSKSAEMALNMVKIAYESGTDKIIVTPHVGKNSGGMNISDINKRLEQLKVLVKKKNIDIDIYAGQQVYYNENIVEQFNKGVIGTINNSRYILIELPIDTFEVKKVIDNLSGFLLKGIIPIVCHPERCFTFMENPLIIDEFLKEGILFSLSSGSIVGDFGWTSKAISKRYLKKGVYSFLGSDSHRDTVRNPDMSKAIIKIGRINADYLALFNENGNSVIENKEIRRVVL